MAQNVPRTIKHREIVIVRLHPDNVRQFLARRLAENPLASNASQHTVAPHVGKGRDSAAFDSSIVSGPPVSQFQRMCRIAIPSHAQSLNEVVVGTHSLSSACERVCVTESLVIP